jgi:hypothetical protein
LYQYGEGRKERKRKEKKGEETRTNLNLLIDRDDDGVAILRQALLTDEDLLNSGSRVGRGRPDEVGAVDEAIGRNLRKASWSGRGEEGERKTGRT